MIRKAMIFAAGKGERLAPLTEHLPKPLFPIINKPIIEFNIELLANAGVEEIAINLYHLGHLIRQELGDGSKFGVKITYFEEPVLLGTGGGLKNAEDFFQDEEAFFVLNGDTIIDIDLHKVAEHHKASGADATMVMYTKADKEIFGTVGIDANGDVVQIGNKLLKEDAQIKKRHVFAGVHVVGQKLFEFLPPAASTCIANYGYAKLISNGGRVSAYMMDTGYWNDLGIPERYLETNMQMLSRSIKFEHIDPYSAYGNKPEVMFVAIADSAQLGTNVTIHPPAVIGEDSEINSSIGPFCCVGKECYVGKHCTVQHSVILPGTRISSRTKIEDAIVAGKYITYVKQV